MEDLSSTKVSLVDTPRKRPVIRSLSRRERKAAARRKMEKERVLRKIFRMLKPEEPMTKEEIVTESHILYKHNYLTKDQARLMGCNIK